MLIDLESTIMRKEKNNYRTRWIHRHRKSRYHHHYLNTMIWESFYEQFLQLHENPMLQIKTKF